MFGSLFFDSKLFFCIAKVFFIYNKKQVRELTCLDFLVAPNRFELSISALRGRRPEPLDDGATYM